ncbi:MAG: cobyrinate a,c-diamide synthase [Chloroflexi bacterium]|nr:cobyrinate a,c-diamide synthase [Chloroflexota bacterium]
MIPRIVVAGTASGVGKTSIVAGLSRALVRQGLRVAPFKVGPDYIDPTYHALATGRTCRNLDSWLLPREALLATFARGCRGADLAVIEGVMGLYDGRTDRGERGSTAEVAKWLRAPILLTLDVAKQARSAAATAVGFQQFDPTASIAAFVLNRVGSPNHTTLLRRAVEAATGRPVVGALPRHGEATLPERHLGLVPEGEHERASAAVEALADLVESAADLNAIVALAQGAAPLPQPADTTPAPVRRDRPILAVARDAAFSFYYEDNLELLAALGARLAFFSPLDDSNLPPGARGVYLGGGFPELYAKRLAANRSLLAALRRAHARGSAMYAECGGLMLLARTLVDSDGRRHELAGLLPCDVVMTDARVALGYVELEATQDLLLCPAGTRLRGHEFHWSRLAGEDNSSPAYRVLAPPGGDARNAGTNKTEGFAMGHLLASYAHLHFASAPDLARAFVAAL